MTPFDVVKVRLQTQSHQSIHKVKNQRMKLTQLPHHLKPITDDLTPSPKKFKGSLDAVIKISRHEGFSALWKGLTPTL